MQCVLEQQGGTARFTTGSWSRERGATRLPQMALLFCALGAAFYFGKAYLPIVMTYYQVSQEARKFVQNSPKEYGAVNAFVTKVRAETGLAIDPRDIRLKQRAGQIQAMQLDLKLPLHFPFLRAGRAVNVEIAADRGAVAR